MASPLSPRETQVLGLAWQCFESEPKINWEKFAELTGYAKSSADTSLRRIKNKLKLHAKGFEKGTAVPPAHNAKKSSKKTLKKTSKSIGKSTAGSPSTAAESRQSKKRKQIATTPPPPPEVCASQTQEEYEEGDEAEEDKVEAGEADPNTIVSSYQDAGVNPLFIDPSL